MSNGSISPTTASVGSAADRATDAALAKATAKLATDRKAGASADTIRADQKSIAILTKAAQKADEAAAPAAASSPSAATGKKGLVDTVA